LTESGRCATIGTQPKKGSTLENKPLVLLDVDGVINDLTRDGRAARNFESNGSHTAVISFGFTVAIPNYMPELIQKLVENCEVLWCTTWRDHANAEIRDHLGIPKLTALTDGTNRRVTDWKAGASYGLAEAALEEGREVWWIEDFYGMIPYSEMPRGTKFIDTEVKDRKWGSWEAVLRPDMIPPHLLGE